MKVETEEGIWEVRKPFAREVMILQSLDPNNLDSDESYEVMKKILEKVIISGPEKYKNNGTWDLETVPADIFFLLFFESCGSTIKVLGKLSPK